MRQKSIFSILLFSTCLMVSCSTSKVNLEPYFVQWYMSAKNGKNAYEAIYESYTYQDYQETNLSWTCDDPLAYKVFIADNKEFNNPYVDYCFDEEYSGGACIPGKKYYVRVYNLHGQDEIQEMHDHIYGTEYSENLASLPNRDPIYETTFTAKSNTVRFINVKGMNNVRDIGGWKAENGKRIPYGKIYRGGRPNSVAAIGKYTMKELLKIKTEIDLRTHNSDDGGMETCPWDENVSLIRAPFSGYSYIYPTFDRYNEELNIHRTHDKRTPESMRNAFEAFADPDNYPLYFHCNAGADRTGTLGFLLLGLLGVSIDDITRDFELTSFTQYGLRFRCDPYTTKDFSYGTMQDDKNNFVDWGGLYQTMMDEYSEGKNLAYAIKNYLVTVTGIEANKLDQIKKNILG